VPRTRVIIESPFKGDITHNMMYLSLCLRDSILNHNESPYASHGLLTMALDDDNDLERDVGIKCGYEWQAVADKVIVSADLGVSGGMKACIDTALRNDMKVEHRKLPPDMLEQLANAKYDYV